MQVTSIKQGYGAIGKTLTTNVKNKATTSDISKNHMPLAKLSLAQMQFNSNISFSARVSEEKIEQAIKDKKEPLLKIADKYGNSAIGTLNSKNIDSYKKQITPLTVLAGMKMQNNSGQNLLHRAIMTDDMDGETLELFLNTASREKIAPEIIKNAFLTQDNNGLTPLAYGNGYHFIAMTEVFEENSPKIFEQALLMEDEKGVNNLIHLMKNQKINKGDMAILSEILGNEKTTEIFENTFLKQNNSQVPNLLVLFNNKDKWEMKNSEKLDTIAEILGKEKTSEMIKNALLAKDNKGLPNLFNMDLQTSGYGDSTADVVFSFLNKEAKAEILEKTLTKKDKDGNPILASKYIEPKKQNDVENILTVLAGSLGEEQSYKIFEKAFLEKNDDGRANMLNMDLSVIKAFANICTTQSAEKIFEKILLPIYKQGKEDEAGLKLLNDFNYISYKEINDKINRIKK